MILIKVFIFFKVLSWVKSQNIFMPNLPLGEYRTVFDKVYHCESTKNHSIKLNFYFNKKTPSITELKGNATYLIPLDDTLSLDANVASWSLTGGWKPNSVVYVTKNACSNLKKLLGNAWNSLLKGFIVPSTNCPIPAGTYTTSGINLKELEDHNSPKVYFYGKYKLLFKIKNVENKVITCGVLEFRLLRPWENPLNKAIMEKFVSLHLPCLIVASKPMTWNLSTVQPAII